MKKILYTTIAILGFANFAMAQVPSYVPTDSLKGWWGFNGNANDLSGNGNNGTVNGAILATDRFGNTNSAYNFDGVNDYIGTNLSGITGQNSRTISFWFNSNNNTSGIKTMVGYGEHASSAPQGSRFDCTIENGKLSIDIGYTFASYTVNNVQNNWKFYTVAFASSYGTTVQAIKLYIDGVLQQNPSILNTSILLNTGNLYKVFFGAPYTNPSGNSFNGKLDDIGIWNRALTQQEISNLYNGNICYQTITVTDTLVINVNRTGYNPITYSNTLKVYPNPTKDRITIDNGDITKMSGYSIKIYNSIGQQLFQTTISQQQYSLDITQWGGNGLYFMELKDNNGNIIDIKKIVLQ